MVARVRDGFGGVAMATATIQVNPVNDAPVANDDSYSFIKNTTFRERFKVQFRTEMINAFNRVWFGGLNTGITAATYTPVSDLNSNTQYFWRVRALDAGGGGHDDL